MEVKKSPKADLEGKRSTWLLVGYVITLAIMFVAFDSGSPHKKSVPANGKDARRVFEVYNQPAAEAASASS